jgi:hypothetical protein
MEAWRSCALDAAKLLEASEAELTDGKEHFDALDTELKVEWNARVEAQIEVKRLHALVEDAWVEAALAMKREGFAIFAQSESCKARGPNGEV